MCERMEKSFQMLLLLLFLPSCYNTRWKWFSLLHDNDVGLYVCDVRCTFTCLHLHSAIHRNKRENTYTVVDLSNTYKIDMRSTEHSGKWVLLLNVRALQRHKMWLLFGWFALFCSLSLSFVLLLFVLHFKNPLEWVFFRCILCIHVNIVWVEENSNWLWLGCKMLIFSQQHV